MLALPRSFGPYSVETQIRIRMCSLQTIELFKAPKDEVDKKSIQFDSVAASAGLLGSKQSRSAARECIENDAAPLRAVENGVTDKSERFRRRMTGKCFPFLSETTHACILPDVGSVSAEAPKFNIVDVLGAAVLVDENEFVGRAVQ